MAKNNLFDFVKGILGRGAPSRAAPPKRGPRPPALPPIAQKGGDPDLMNPATITHVGRSPDGRDLIMTLGLGSFLVDRETPTICYFRQGNVAEIPTVELRHLFGCLMEKRNVGELALNYVDLLNVASFELQARSGRLKRAPASGAQGHAPKPLPRKPVERANTPQWADHENPATITRVGRSQGGAELVMTLGLGTFVLYRDPPNVRYFDRGREWDVPDGELRVLVEALMAKQDMKEHQHTYVDLLNVATYVRDSRKARRR